MNPRTCFVGAEQFLSYLDNPSGQPGLENHIAECYFCQVRLLAMAGGAQTRGAFRTECQKVVQEIPALMAAEASGEAAAERFWPAQFHLLLCRDCFGVYRELKQMTEMILDDTLPFLSPSDYRAPDLSFLHREESAPQPPFPQRLRLNLALLFQPRQAVPVPVRKETVAQPETPSSTQPAFERVWGAEELGELNVEVKAYPDLNDAAQVRLEVEVHQVTRFDAAGIRVALWMGKAPAIVHHTNTRGVVEFDGLIEDDLHTAVLEITPAPPGDPPRA